MVVLLVVMGVMAVGMSALLPTWRQQSIREKEEELIFRGNQYARALVLYARKNNNILPQDIDVLVSGRYLRKKYKDPITGDDFGLIGSGESVNASGRGGTAPPGRSGGPGSTGGRSGGAGQGVSSSLSGQRIVGSIQGVYSKSTDTSIRRYQNQQRYIDWQFTVQTAQLQMGQSRGQVGTGGAGVGGAGRRFGGDGGIGDRGPAGRGGAGGRGGDGRTGGRGGDLPGVGRGGGGAPTGGGRGGRGGG